MKNYEVKEIKRIFVEMFQQSEGMEEKQITLQELRNTIEKFDDDTLNATIEIYEQTLETERTYGNYMNYYETPLYDYKELLEKQKEMLFDKILELSDLDYFYENMIVEIRSNTDLFVYNHDDDEIKEIIENSIDYLLSQEYQEEIESDEIMFDNIER